MLVFFFCLVYTIPFGIDLLYAKMTMHIAIYCMFTVGYIFIALILPRNIGGIKISVAVKSSQATFYHVHSL